MSEHHVAIVSFEGAMKREIKRLRKRLQACESMSQFRLEIEVSGRVHDGEIKLEYRLDEGYGSTMTAGAILDPVIDELLRRKGWNDVNAAKAIAYEKVPGDDSDPIPF